MKNVLKKICSVLIFFVIIGTIFANTNVLNSITPKNYSNENHIITDENLVVSASDELDFTSLNEISNYMLDQAEFNNYKFSTVVYSSALLFESQESLIIIGHGGFDSNNNFYIGDYSESWINKLAVDKKIVALLSCYSSNIKLDNKIQLSYHGEIDIIKAINDLITLFQWEKNNQFTPTINIQLDDVFDPGGGGGGYLADATVPYNSVRYAYTGWDIGYYWNLFYSSAQASLHNFMLSHLGILVQFTYSGNFLVETSQGSGVYEWEYITTTYDAWFFMNSDDYVYIDFDNVKQNGQDMGKHFAVKYVDLVGIYSTQGYESFVEASDNLTKVLLEVGLALLGIWAVVKLAVKGAAVPGYAQVCLIIGIILLALALILAITVWAISLTWI